jgi:peptide/nickel transport system substrate-binding protein
MTDLTRIHPKVHELETELRANRLDRRSFLRFATLLGVSAATAYGIAGLPMAQAGTAETPKKGGRLRIALRTNDISDPHTYSWGQPMYMRQVLETLTQTGVDNVTRPLLLDRWEASDDLKTWTLHLRQDVTWSNGRPFVADDVVWNLKRVLDPATGSATVGLFAGFILETYETGETDDDGNARTSRRLWREDAIEKIDDHTVVLHGHSPNVVIPELLYHYQVVMLDPADNGVFTLDSANTGPYRIVEFQQGQRALMQARDDYWGEGPYIEELEIIDLGDDPNAHLAAIASNQVDGWPWTDNVTLPALRMLDHVEVYEAHTANTGAVRMRVDQAPFDDPRVRKAMRLAVDNEAVLQLGLGGLGYTAEHHLVSRQHPDYGPVEAQGRDLDEAKRLLEEAGYPDGITGEIYLKSSPAWESQVVQSLIEQWREANINIEMRPVPAAQYWEIWRQVPLGFTDWHHRPLGIMLYGLVFRTGGNWNESGYSNSEFDEILAKAEGAVDVEDRREYMAQLQTILMEDGPIVQPVYRSIYSAWNKKLKNFQLHPTNHNYFKYYWIDET